MEKADKRKIVLIGTGMVGMSYAYALLNQNLCDELVLIDINKKRAEGEAMDLNHGVAFSGGNMEIYAGEYTDCCNADLVVLTAGLPQKEGQKRLHLLKEKGYKIYLLSNYSKDLFEKHTKGADFLNNIDGMVVSYQIHKIKPDLAIYNYLIEKYSLNTDECIFFDDRQINTQAAESLGIKSVTITSKELLLSEMDKLLNV